jgi:hypothetical protein
MWALGSTSFLFWPINGISSIQSLIHSTPIHFHHKLIRTTFSQSYNIQIWSCSSCHLHCVELSCCLCAFLLLLVLGGSVYFGKQGISCVLGTQWLVGSRAPSWSKPPGRPNSIWTCVQAFVLFDCCLSYCKTLSFCRSHLFVTSMLVIFWVSLLLAVVACVFCCDKSCNILSNPLSAVPDRYPPMCFTDSCVVPWD